jgi:ABC-type Fe3+-siderophore transport system permease subunit
MKISNKKGWLVLAVLIMLIIASLLLAVATGAVKISAREIIEISFCTYWFA